MVSGYLSRIWDRLILRINTQRSWSFILARAIEKMNLRADFMTKFEKSGLSQPLIAVQNLCLLSAAVSVTAATPPDWHTKSNSLNLH